MNVNCGIIGLPNVGKSTLFNALIQSNLAETANYPFCTIEPNIGKMQIRDRRLEQIAEVANSEKIVYNQVEILDVAGLIKGASKGEGLGNKFLSYIKEVDVVIHLLRCFVDSSISHIYNDIDPVLDAEVIEMELILADISSVEKKFSQLKNKKDSDKDLKKQLCLMQEVLIALKSGRPARSLEHINKNEMKSLQLITIKPFIYVCNVEDTAVVVGNELSSKIKKIAEANKSKFCYISAKLEEEIANLKDEKEKQSFLLELGLKEQGLDKIAHFIYETMNIITFFTLKSKEAHAWPLKMGSTAIEAANTIHTDFKKGFIKAETINFIDYIKYRSESACKDAGKIRFEGRDYIVQDGDIINFKFNVC